MLYTNNIKSFFGNVANTIKATIAELNPINRFIKFSLEQLFQQIFKDQTISYESLISGIIQLPNLELDTQKINKKYFFATPYTLNSGTIGHLQIKLPSFTQMDKQNIEVEIKKIYLNFEPIQNFEQNFKKIMEEIKDFLYHFVEQKTSDYFVVQKGSKDYFKETLKELLSDMKVRVEDIAICVHLQRPQNEPKNDSFGLLLKVPLINVHRGGDAIKSEKQGVEQTNFDCQIPQFSLHMIDTFSAKHEDFPFAFPSHTHPSTVLMFGLSQFKELKIETDERIPRFNISIWKSIEKAEKRVKLSFKFPQLELMLDPSQIMIIILFAKQINAFSHRLKALKDELKIDEENQQQQQPTQPGLKRSRSNLYSSVSISLLQSSILNLSNFVPNIAKFNQPPNVVDSIIEKNLQSNEELFKSIKEFNSVMGQSISQSTERKSMVEQVQCVNFKQLFQVTASIDSVVLCIQKYNTQSKTQKLWNFQKEFKYPKLQNSYFLLSIQRILFHLKDDKSIQLKVSDFKVRQVKYKKVKELESKKVASMGNSSINEDQFSDLKNSKQFYSSEIPVNQPVSLEHYDAEQILSISHLASDKNSNQQVKSFNLTADLKSKYGNEMYQPAIYFHSYPSNSLQNSLKHNVNQFAVMDIALNLNTEIVKEIVDLYLLIEKEVFTLLKESQDPNDKNTKQKEKLPQPSKGAQSNQITIFTFRAFVFVYLDRDLKDFTSCVQKYQKKIKQDFQTCFCGIKTQGVYLKIQQFELRKMRDNMKVSFSRFGLGLIKIDNSQISEVKHILRILETVHENEVKRKFRLSYQNGKPGMSSRIAVISPQIMMEINKLEEALDFIDLAHRQLESLKPNLIQLMKTDGMPKTNTSAELKSENSNRSLGPILQFFIQKLNVRFLNIETEVHNVCFSKQNSNLSLKFSTLVVALRDSIEFYTSQMQNQKPVLTPIPKSAKYSNILTTNVAIEFHMAPSLQFKCVQQKMSQFLHKISKAQTTFLLTVKNSDISRNSVQQKPHQSFSKPLKSSNMISQKIMGEQAQTGNINITLTAPIYANAIILLRIIQAQDEYDNFFGKVKVYIQKMKGTVNQIFPLEKDVKKQKSQVSPSKEIIVSKGTLNIEIRPTFLESSNNYDKNSKFKKQPKRVIFSNTRSFVQLTWEQTKITQDQKQKYFDGSVNLKFYFKHSQNQDKVQNVPTNFESKGFIEVLKLQKLIYKIQIIQKKIRINVEINSVSFKSSIEILTWLNLHFKHFLYHNIKRNLGFTQQQNQDRTVQLKIQDFDLSNTKSEIVNLNDGEKVFKQKDKRKKQLEAKFMAQKFVKPPLDEKCEFYIQKFSINSIQLKLTNKAKAQSSIDILAKNLQIQGKIPEFTNFSLKVFGSISDLKIVHNNKQQKGSWGFFSSVSNYVYSNCYGEFTILQNHGQIKFLLENDDKRTYIKFDKCTFDVGFRSVILEIVDTYNQFKLALKESGWKKVYDEPKSTKKSDQTHETPLILVAIPENTISVSLIYDWYTILSKRSVQAPKFILHEESDKINKIDEFVIDWVKTLLSKNVSGLVAGALMESFNLVVSQIVNLISFLLSCIF